MVGSWIINIFFGFVGFMIGFVSSFSTNTFETSLIRGFMSFVSFFLIAYLFRWSIHFIMRDTKGNTTISHSTNHDRPEEPFPSLDIGQSIDSLNEEEAKLASSYIKELLK